MDYSSIQLSQRLAFIIKDRYKIQWMKFSMYRETDAYYQIPALCFRFEEGEEKQAILVDSILRTYKGNCEWTIFKNPLSRNLLYIISIVEYKEYCDANTYQNGTMSSLSYFGESTYKELCDKALKDLPPLCKHLEIS